MITAREMMFNDKNTQTTILEDGLRYAANFIVHPEEGATQFQAARVVLVAVLFFATIGIAYFAASKFLDHAVNQYAQANNLEIYNPTKYDSWDDDDI